MDLNAEQKQFLNGIFQDNLKPVENLLSQLMQRYDRVWLGSPEYDPDALVKEFAAFIQSKKNGNANVDEELRVAYREFALQHQILVEEGDITNANPSLLLLLRGMEYFVKRLESRVHEKYDQFLQQISLLFIGLETAARPAVEIFQMEIPTIKEELADHYAFPAHYRFEASSRQKYNEGHLGGVPFTFHTRLKAKLLDITESHHKNTVLNLELTYHGATPEQLPPISAFFYGDNPQLRYRFLWLLKTASIDKLSFRFPLHNFAYPQELANTPYQQAWRYLDPYPAVLDFLFEIHDCDKDHFRPESYNLWKASYRIELREKLVKPPKGDWNDSFFINALPVFYWHPSEVYLADNKIRLCEEAARTIWIRAGKEDQQLPVPLYYVDDSGEGTGWISHNEKDLFLHVLPQRKDKPLPKAPLGVQALFAGYPVKRDEKLLLNSETMTASQRTAVQVKRLVACENMGDLRFQPRRDWAEPEQHFQFWEMLNQSFRQVHDDGYIKTRAKDYLLRQLQPYDFKAEWLEVAIKERSLALVGDRLIPSSQLSIRLNLEQVEKAGKSPSQIVGVMWRGLDRFHAYLSERLPPNLALHIGLYDTKHPQPLFTWK